MGKRKRELRRGFRRVKTPDTYVVSVRPPARPHVSARLPMDGYSLNLLSETVTRIRREIPDLVEIRQEHRALDVTTFNFVLLSGTKYFVTRQ
jgi:hypothetical protein